MDFHFSKALEAVELEPVLPFRKKFPPSDRGRRARPQSGGKPVLYSCFALVGAGFNDLVGTLRIFLRDPSQAPTFSVNTC